MGYNTYAIELLARQIVASDCSIETLANNITDGIYGLNSLEKIRSCKDGRIIKNTVPDIIHSLYSLANLNENQKQALRNLFLLRFLNIDRQTYLKFCWSRPDNMDIVNDLVEIGWIQKNNRYYYLHPLVEELVDNELKPCEENCCHIFLSMRIRMERCVDLSDSIEFPDKVESGLNCELAIKFLNGLDMTIASNLKLSIDWLLNFIDRETAPDLPDQNTLYALLSKIEKEAYSANLPSETQFDIYYILFAYWLCEYNSYYLGDTQNIAVREERRIAGLDYSFNMAKQNEHLFLEVVYNESAQKNQDQDEETLTTIAFREAHDKISFIQSIAANTNLSHFQRAERINYCTCNAFDYVGRYKNYSKEKWEELHRILDIEHKVLNAALQQDLSEVEAEECYNSLKENICNQCVVYAALEEREDLEQQIRLLFDYFCSEAERILDSDSSFDVKIDIFYSLIYINEVINRLCSIDKAHILFPCIFELENSFTQILKNSSLNDERIIMYIYKPIQESAEHALEEDVPHKQKFQKIVQKYEKLKKQTSDVNFSFKSDDE